MQKTAILLIALMVVGVGFLSVCTASLSLPMGRTGGHTINGNNVTLHATLTDLEGNPSANCWFKYGTNPDNLDKSTNVTVLNSTGTFEANIIGLSRGTWYWYQAVLGTSNGWRWATGIESFLIPTTSQGTGDTDGTGGTDGTESEMGVPWWAWPMIILAVIAAIVALLMGSGNFGRGSKKEPDEIHVTYVYKRK